jgi:hypothetical protein
MSPGWRNNERDEQWTVCRDMIRRGSNELRAHFTRATISTWRLPRREQTSRSRQSGTVVSAPYRAAISAGSGSTWWRIPGTRRSPTRRAVAPISEGVFSSSVVQS